MSYFLFLIGVLLGAVVNYAVAVLAWHPRRDNPWCSPPLKAPRRQWYDRIPVLGWLGMRREAAIYGRFFWIRPILVELGMGLFAVWFYGFHVTRIEWLSQPYQIPMTSGEYATLVGRYVVQMVFVTLMLAASLIDLDEKVIPDTLTITGTLFALIVSGLFPLTWGDFEIQPLTQLPFFPETFWEKEECDHALLYPLTASAPRPALGVMRQEGVFGLATALVCWWGWCFAMMRRPWRTRHGLRKAFAILYHRLRRSVSTHVLIQAGWLGTFAIALVWLGNSQHWLVLWSSLLGMGISGAFFWAIRIASSIAMGREALGFGDVILMAMLGAFMGWQPCILVFFIAPFAALFMGIFFLLILRDSAVPYGPFLCLAALFTIVFWEPLWMITEPIFQLGPLLFPITALLLGVMMVLLLISRGIKKLLGIDA
ncbi:MAG: A24 family peptidase [Planctomycetia bacterium]|nr:A24 family peptidase [Planctomycetia bacterium]